MLFIEPPLYAAREEKTESRGHRCAYCNGRGHFTGDVNPYGIEQPRRCPVCGGCGLLDAEITISWKPSRTAAESTGDKPLKNK